MVHSYPEHTSLTANAANKLRSLVSSAADVFAQVGYGRAQMSDIAARAGVSIGTPYRYCEGKGVYFDLAVRLGFGADPLEGVASLPISERAQSDTLQFVRGTFAHTAQVPILERGFSADESAADQVRCMIEGVYDILSAHHLGIRIVDRSAREWPELAALFFREVRQPGVEKLERFIRAGVEAGELCIAGSFAAMARFVLETCAWFAMHRRFDPAPPACSDDEAREIVVESLSRALLCEL